MTEGLWRSHGTKGSSKPNPRKAPEAIGVRENGFQNRKFSGNNKRGGSEGGTFPPPWERDIRREFESGESQGEKRTSNSLKKVPLEGERTKRGSSRKEVERLLKK